ncbi:MAG: 50S ribosomal protein L35 [Chloroflexi bacterium]|nr:MAG: 50S ribosomal protein L35 [Chloroflexota bacterium]RLC96642.1 MAG: 50S ribosomal protein L35 [Chloroflexota bacterium]
MPKLKTHKSAKRRIRITGTGKIMHAKIGKSHLRRKKPPRVKRQYAGQVVASSANRTRLERLVPYR